LLLGTRDYLLTDLVFQRDVVHRDLLSFPTRRSSDLSGYTVITAIPSAYQGVSSCFIVDMNGNKVHEWPKLLGFPNKVFPDGVARSEEHTSELQSRFDLVCRLLLEKKNQPIVEKPPRQ